jgi:hypothetical protein
MLRAAMLALGPPAALRRAGLLEADCWSGMSARSAGLASTHSRAGRLHVPTEGTRDGRRREFFGHRERKIPQRPPVTGLQKRESRRLMGRCARRTNGSPLATSIDPARHVGRTRSFCLKTRAQIRYAVQPLDRAHSRQGEDACSCQQQAQRRRMRDESPWRWG